MKTTLLLTALLAATASFQALAHDPGSDAALQEKILSLARALSTPDAARILPAFSSLDRNGDWSKELAPLAEPYGSGEAGVQELVRRIISVRAAIARKHGNFGNTPLQLKNVHAKPSNIHLELDFAPAEALLDLLESGEQNQARIIARLQQPGVRHVFEELIMHRSQSFYGVPMSWEMLAQNISLANSDAALPRLYGYAQPYAFLDFAGVRNHITEYRRIVKTLSDHRVQLLEEVLAGIQDYVPADAHFDRKVSILFCAGADGWAGDDVAGLDLEYYGDDYASLINIMTHETYHAAQKAVALAKPDTETGTHGPQEIWNNTLDSLFLEGTATFVAAPRKLDDVQQEDMAKRAIALIHDLENAVFLEKDTAHAKKIYGEAVSGSGPIYWLGLKMSQAIVADSGAEGLSATLPGGRAAFLQAYAKAAAPRKGSLPERST